MLHISPCKIEGDLASLKLCVENKQINLEIVLHSLGKFIDLYGIICPNTYGFIILMQRQEEKVMRPNKWLKIEKRVMKQQLISLLDFK